MLPKEEEQYYGKVHEIRHESTDGYRWVQMGTRGYSMDGTRGYKRVQEGTDAQESTDGTH